jgi:hypothetical protein
MSHPPRQKDVNHAIRFSFDEVVILLLGSQLLQSQKIPQR